MDTPTFNPDAATLPPRATPSDGQTLPQNLPPAAPPITIPDYELLGELGRGGMGVVYRAQQRKLKRIVALKMVLGSGCVSDDSLGRFRAEAEAVARLQHPNIVQVYEVGDSSGMPFFSLEFVDGGSLDRKLHGTPLPAKEAARLVRTLALAIQHAHDHGIIHRDLKPANVLLMSDGTPKVTDFGLAKQIDSDSGQTKSGAILGTPSYMAPEQAAGETKLIGPLADVYALGAILYECLTGRPPFRAPTPLDTVLQVINENPVAPTRLQPDTPRDLETICLKCLYKSPKRRYASAQELADDLDRFLNGDPIQARPASAWEKSRHWCKKNPKKARFVASAIVSAVIMSGFLTKSRSDALANASKSERERKATADALLVAEERKREADTAKTAAQEAEAEVKEEKNAAVARLYASSIYLAHREWDANNVFRAEQLLNDCPQDMRGWEWDFVKGLCRQDVQRLAGHFSAVDQICFGPNGISLFTSGSDGLRSWNLAAGRETAGVLPHTPFAVHPDGKWMAAGSNGQALLLNAADGQLLQSVYIGPYTINALAFSADGQSMHVSTQTGGLWRWNFTAGTAPVKSQSTPAFNYINQSGSFRPVFSHDASIIAAGSNGGSISVWDFAKGTKKFDLDGHVMHTTQTAFSPDGRWLASASGDAQIILWNLADGKEIRRFKGHGGEVRCVAFSPDGKQLATGGADKVVRIWDTTEPVYRARANVLLALKSLDMKGYRPLLSEGGQTYYGHIGPTLAFAFSDDGRFVATSGNGDPSILVWNLPDHRVQHVLPIPFRQYNRLAFSHDGNLLVTAGAVVSADSPSEIVFWNTRTGKSIRKVRGPICERTACAFSPDATTVSVAFRTGNGSEIISWDAGSGAETWRSPKLPARLGANSLAYSPDGRELVIGIDTGVAIWPVGADRSRLEIAAPMGSAGATVSRRGLIATAGNDASIRLWSTADGKPVSTLDGHVGNVQSLGFSPDGDRLISAGNEMAVKVWDVPNGRELLTFRDHRRPITQVGWSPDGSRIASCGFDGTLKVWEAHRSASASAAAWPVVFSDRFDRSELGPNWTANPKIWTIQNGMAVGKLSPFVLSSGLTFQTAILTLKAADLPTTFALKFDVRVDQPQMASSIFINPRSKQSLQPLLSGRNDRGGLAAGASLLMMSSDQMATSVGVPRAKFVFRPGRVYHVRVLREPKTIVLEVDGSEVLSERIPDFEAPALSLQGSWGDQGDIVRFSNVELRAPLTAVRAREIRSRVEERFDDLLLKSLVAEELAKDATLSDEDRQTVAKSLSDCQENIETLAAGAVSVAQEPNREPAAYRLALAQAREIVQRAPENWRYLFVLGIAHYRVGEFTPALGRIESSIELARKLDGAAEPNQWAMLALTANKLQQSERARDAYVRMRDSLADHSIADAPNSQYFAGEVTRDLGSIIAEIQLANAEKEAIKKLVWGADTAGWGEGDLARYMAQRSADYHEITARSEPPGPYDVDWDRATVEQVRRLQFRPGRVPNVKVVHEDVQVDIHGESATMSDRSIVLETNYFRATQSVCQLKRTDGRWQIVSVRHWPVSEKLGPALKAFDSSFWAARDSDVEKEQKGGVPRKIARALHEAQRDREALPIAQKYCEDAIANATDWSFRGDIAVEAGDIDDAREAFRKAMAIDPEVELPWYIRRFLWAHGTNWAQLATTILPDGRVASGGFDKVVTLLGPTGSVLGAIAGASNAVASVAGSPDGKTIVAGAFGGDNELLVIDVVEQKIRRRLTGLTGTIFRVGVSPDGSKAFSASADNTARIWNLATGQETLKLSHDDFVLGAAYSPDGSQIATASHDKTCRLWDALTGRLIATFSFKSQLKRVHFHPNGQRLAVATTDGTIAVVDLATKQVQEWKAHKGTAEVVLFSPDGRWLASAGDDGTIRIWDWTNKKKTAALAGHSAAVYALAFSADGKRLVSASSDGTIRMWDAVIEP